MKPLALELTRLIGKKELSFGCLVHLERDDDNDICTILNINWSNTCCWEDWYNILNSIWNYSNASKTGYDKYKWDFKIDEIIWHPATLANFIWWIDEKSLLWSIDVVWIKIEKDDDFFSNIAIIPYDSNKDLLYQETSTLEQIISLIKSYA